MASAFGWYGPLIDLRTASSHIGDFVQLLVFVHRSFPVQCKSSKRGDIMRTDIQVGDDTTPYLGVALWQKHMGSKVAAGDVILLQNVKIAKYADVVEARTVQWSSLCCLVHPYEALISKDVEELITGCRVGTTAKDKLRRVIKWVQQSRSTVCNIKLQSDQLYVWDESDYMPVIVKNSAAEILFGNIKAEKVHLSYREQMLNHNPGPRYKCKDNDAVARHAKNLRLSGEGLSSTSMLDATESLQLEEKHLVEKFNFYDVWLIFLKLLLQQGNNSPLKFEIIVNPSLNVENGRLEMVSATMPCFGTK